jgi:hypothetical protein
MRNLERIESTVPVMLDLADNDLQRGALRAIKARATSWRMGISQLADNLVARSQLLSNAVDGNQAAMDVELRPRPVARGGRQSHQQRDQIQCAWRIIWTLSTGQAAGLDAVSNLKIAANADESFIGIVLAFCIEKSCRPALGSGTGVP